MSCGPKPKPLAERFWPKVAIADPESCWPWQGARYKPGRPHYGAGFIHSGITGKFLMAYRAAYALTYGPIPDGMCVCHHCDNPPCCNPAHLFLGTRADNNRDRDEKGRGRPGRAAPELLSQPGEANGNARLTWEIVREIRRRRETEAMSTMALAQAYGISRPQAYNIVSGRQWKEPSL